MATIEDGNSGLKAEVNAENELVVRAITEEEIERRWNKWANDQSGWLGYDIMIAESAHNVTTKAANFLAIMEMFSTGMIPPQPQLIIEASLLPKETKDKLLESYQQQVQAEAQKEQAVNQREILKSPVGQQLIQGSQAQ